MMIAFSCSLVYASFMKHSARQLHVLQRSPYWFRAKTYGWGWVPVSWQGWMVVVIYMYAVGTVFFSVDSRSHSISDTLFNFILPCILATVVMIGICYRTSEPSTQKREKTFSPKRKTSHAT